MTDWEPATEVEAAMRDALRAGDQELYFRILARSELLLPVSSEALAGRAPVGWGTWTTNGRTHVLAFTSGDALRICLADNAGSARRMPYHDLASSWPNLEWWLAVNPGLPIEGYLPAWFVSQLARGDVRLPGRTMGARARLDRAESAARARARASVPGPVVQGEIIEPPFVDRAAAVTGPVLEPDSIEPPQRNRPTRPPGFDSPIAASRRRGGVPPADATPSSPATPPPYRQPLPPPQVTDATPLSPAAPPPYRQPVADAASSSVETPSPYRQPLPPPRVSDATPLSPAAPPPYRQPLAPPVNEAVPSSAETPAPYRQPLAPPLSDAMPSSAASPAPYREPSPPPQVSDATPYPPQRSTDNGFGRQPAPNGEAAAWPPPGLRGEQPPPRPLRPAPDPREVSERPAPAMRPRSPLREDPARGASPPGRFGAPPRPPARPTSGGGFFGADQSEPAARQPLRDDPRQGTWSPANGTPASPAGTPNGVAPARPASAWPSASGSAPAGATPAGTAQPSQGWPARQAGSPPSGAAEVPAQSWADGPSASPQRWSDTGQAGSPAPGQVRPESGGSPRPQSTQPWPAEAPVPATGEPRPQGTARPAPDHVGSPAADLWSDRTANAGVSAAPGTPQGWAAGPTAASSATNEPAVAGTPGSAVPQAQPPAADLWTRDSAMESGPRGTTEQPAGAPKTPRATDLWTRRKPAAGAEDQAAQQRPDAGPPSAGQSQPRPTDPRPDQQRAAAAADLWSAKPAPEAAAGTPGPSSVDLWSDSKPDQQPRASQEASDGNPPTDHRPAASTRSDERAGAAAQPRATDLWSSRQPPRGSAKVDDRRAAGQPTSAPSGLWSDRSATADGQASEPQPRSDAAATPPATGPGAADLWSDRSAAAAEDEAPRDARTSPDSAGQSPPNGPATAHGTDLWASGATDESAAVAPQPTEGAQSSAPAVVDMTPTGPTASPPTTQDWADRPSAGWGNTWDDRTPSTGTAAPSWLDQPQPQRQDTVFTADPGPVPADFRPANDVEESLLTAAGDGSTDTFLSTLLLARVLLPVSPDSRPDAQPGSDGFVWRTETIDDEPYVVVFTSPERMAEHLDQGHDTVTVKFVKLINSWPQENWSFAVNPGTPVGAKLPGAQIVALASWAADVGLDASDDEPAVAAAPKQEEPAPAPEPTAVDPTLPTMMQKTIAPSQVDYYLERGYDRVSGFVHRVSEVAHLRTPAQLFTALGLGYANSPFSADADEVYVLRWPAYRPSLYRIPYGGPNENAMRAMEGWVIERSPFRGNGFAPGEGSDVIAEFKVDSARLPHGAQLWLVRRDGSERVVATLDADAPGWNRNGDK